MQKLGKRGKTYDEIIKKLRELVKEWEKS